MTIHILHFDFKSSKQPDVHCSLMSTVWMLWKQFYSSSFATFVLQEQHSTLTQGSSIRSCTELSCSWTRVSMYFQV